jgi:hypothetical protein
MLDKNGNGVGGYRTPYVDVPAATYHVSSKGETFCPELGRIEPFDWAKLNSLYRHAAEATPRRWHSQADRLAERALPDGVRRQEDQGRIVRRSP